MGEPERNPTVIVQPQPQPPSGNPVVVATGLIDALRQQPMLLVVVVLNIAMIFSAAFFLLRLEEYRHLERLEMFKLIDKHGLGSDSYPTGPVRPSSLADRREKGGGPEMPAGSP